MDDDPTQRSPAASVLVSEVRDYDRINAELIRLLDLGHPLIRLLGVAGQRLLASSLKGAWNAEIRVEGDAGPELAADLDAPGLVIDCEGSAADGAGRSLHAGALIIRGSAGDAVAYRQAGGTIVVAGDAGARAGLGMTGGVLVVMGEMGRLAGDRQAGGTILARAGHIGPFPSRGQRGGDFVRLSPQGATRVALPVIHRETLCRAMDQAKRLGVDTASVDRLTELGGET
jgi:methylamine---glutamate N-methyltransferase subunit B